MKHFSYLLAIFGIIFSANVAAQSIARDGYGAAQCSQNLLTMAAAFSQGGTAKDREVATKSVDMAANFAKASKQMIGEQQYEAASKRYRERNMAYFKAGNMNQGDWFNQETNACVSWAQGR